MNFRVLVGRKQVYRLAGLAGQGEAGEIDVELRQLIVRRTRQQQSHRSVAGRRRQRRRAVARTPTTARQQGYESKKSQR
jgi:hypothetical protein